MPLPAFVAVVGILGIMVACPTWPLRLWQALIIIAVIVLTTTPRMG